MHVVACCACNNEAQTISRDGQAIHTAVQMHCCVDMPLYSSVPDMLHIMPPTALLCSITPQPCNSGMQELDITTTVEKGSSLCMLYGWEWLACCFSSVKAFWTVVSTLSSHSFSCDRKSALNEADCRISLSATAIHCCAAPTEAVGGTSLEVLARCAVRSCAQTSNCTHAHAYTCDWLNGVELEWWALCTTKQTPSILQIRSRHTQQRQS